MGSNKAKKEAPPGPAQQGTFPLASLPPELLGALASHLPGIRDRCRGAGWLAWQRCRGTAAFGVPALGSVRWLRQYRALACVTAGLALPRRVAVACSAKAVYETARQSAAFWGALELEPTSEEQVGLNVHVLTVYGP